MARAGLHGDFSDLDYHKGLSDHIMGFTVEGAQAAYAEDKRRIDALVLEKSGSFEIASATVRCGLTHRNRGNTL